MIYYLKKIFIHSPGHYIGAAVVAVLMGVFRFCTLPEGLGPRYACYEIFTVSGFATFLVGGLLMVAYLGAFDLFGYVFSPGRVKGRKKYESYADYSFQKKEIRSRSGCYFVPYYVVGILVMLLSCFFG